MGEGSGSTFYVLLPRDVSQSAAGATPSFAHLTLRGRDGEWLAPSLRRPHDGLANCEYGSDFVTDARPEHVSAVRTEDFATACVRIERGTAAVVFPPAVQASASERKQFEHGEPGRILAVASR
jgi:hypothetical protein